MDVKKCCKNPNDLVAVLELEAWCRDLSLDLKDLIVLRLNIIKYVIMACLELL